MKRLLALLLLPMLLPLAAKAQGQKSTVDAVVIFGIPLGGRLGKPIRTCPDTSKKRTELCWVDKPFISSDGSRSGMASLPNANLPAWAEFAMSDLTTERDGTLSNIKFDIKHIDDQGTILASISTRFGKPTFSNLESNILKTATWDRKEIFIDYQCAANKFCQVSFRSPAYEQKNREFRARLKREVEARPATP